LRAGQGRSFLWRRLHSISGLFPIAVFLLEHFFSNAFAVNGPHAYAEEVRFLTSLPFLIGLEVLFIYLPILYHGVYGIYVWYRGESNLGRYAYVGNWGYTMQRWTGAITFCYIIWHTLTMRWLGVHLVGNPGAAFGKVQMEFQNPWALVFYIVAVLCASAHLSYGLWLFCAKWGITAGEKGRRNCAVVCALICLFFLGLGYSAMLSFLKTPQQPVGEPASQIAERVQPTR
jgi:succinate dehydrogenase / fumarate reductase cytochrome b subunit